MEKMVLNPKKSKLSQKTARYGLIIVGAFLFVMPQYLVEGFPIYLIKTIGIFFLVPAVANPFSIFGGNDKMILSDDFVKVTDEMTLTRTAYWKK